MEEAGKTDSHMTSAAAFVEGGIQPACDDACSICLEPFCENDPSTVTGCKHEFHLQCILEWCQRSSQCPMCWQSISLKDPTSQELLEAVERERSLRLTPARNGTIFRHPALGDFELQHLSAGANDAELEERIMQHLAAAAAMGRAHHMARREGQRSRSSANGRPHYLVFSTHPSAPPAGGENESAPSSVASPSVQSTPGSDESSRQSPLFSMVHPSHVAASASGSRANVNSAAGQSSTQSLDRAGPSDFQSFSESVKSRLTAVSTRYKESISKSTKGWREKLFSRNTSMADLGSEVRREVSAGIASVSRMMEHLETRQTSMGELNQQDTESNGEDGLNDGDTPPPHAASSVSN